ncbi:hypothetical protein LshimejAT787_0703840 [Lyophyllum shimeji]|uniref:Uncharacterized protein n=1 Tax=Lyophyllum shimeji TaxID=47721 RepID=A0A9P3PQS2_LYOSH|nr:hypothetical protein LshimejAT787_0703840 [Lyophyllum shimeji]
MAAMTVLVCNTLVNVMFLYRVFWKDEDDTVHEPSETSKSTHPLPLTSTFITPPATTTFVLTELSRPPAYSTGTGLSTGKSISFVPCEKESSITPPTRRLSV